MLDNFFEIYEEHIKPKEVKVTSKQEIELDDPTFEVEDETIIRTEDTDMSDIIREKDDELANLKQQIEDLKVQLTEQTKEKEI